MPSSTLTKDPLVCNASALRKASRRVTQLYDAALEPSGLTITQRAMLVHIERAGSPTITQLARDLVMDRSALAHSLKPLERDACVVQLPDATDRRSRRVELTARGRERLAESNELWRGAQIRFEEVYGPQRAAALRVTLAEIFSEEFGRAFRCS